ncbi:uncharacterized protein LOC144292990 isoform X4 [Canis aureus]
MDALSGEALANEMLGTDKYEICDAGRHAGWTSGWNGLNIPVQFIWSNVSFKTTVSLLIFCLDALFLDGKNCTKETDHSS